MSKDATEIESVIHLSCEASAVMAEIWAAPSTHDGKTYVERMRDKTSRARARVQTER